ncbi:MAG: hypothetical protein LBG59_09105 [Candidatus Peribacteria bacterium]|jgi:CRISPR-associated protein Cpf1|nr:hypothetical protein [Candidatus Peribacteria bacterium]
MLPKVFFSAKNIDYFAPSPKILEIRKKESFKQGENFSSADLHQWIDFMKTSLQKHKEWSAFSFSFKPTQVYERIDTFYAEVEHQGYKISFVPINEKVLMNQVETGNLYLFQIYSKDFSENKIVNKNGKSNLQTMYRKALFEPENFANGPIFKLNGGAEIFFRPKTKELEKKQKKLVTPNE